LTTFNDPVGSASLGSKNTCRCSGRRLSSKDSSSLLFSLPLMPVGEIDGTEVSGKPVIVCDEDVRAGDVLAAMLYNKEIFFFPMLFDSRG
jgi:hypothetical protein